MKMPKITPLLIETKDKCFLKRLWLWITAVRHWQLLEDWHYTLPDKTMIVIPKGFVFDGASSPRIMWSILSPTGLLLIPGLIHDFGYRYDYLWSVDKSGKYSKYKKGAGKHHWDNLFRTVAEKVNDMTIIDRAAWMALLLFGDGAWNENRILNDEDILPCRSSYLIPRWLREYIC